MNFSSRFFKLFVPAMLILLFGAGGTFLLIRRLAERPRPTVFGRRAAVETYAGDGAPGFADGAARAARFADPFGVAVDREGNVYVADAGRNNRIRKLTPDGQVSTLAGGAEGFADGAGTAASFNTPSSLAIDREGNLYVADTSNNRIRKVDPTGQVTTLAGDGAAGFRDGAAKEAQFNAPVGVAADERGNVYVADTYNDRIRQVTPDGQVKTLAGAGEPGYRDGPAADALFDTPCAVAVNKSGELFVADTGNRRVRKLTADGQVTTLSVTFNVEHGDSTDTAQTNAGGETQAPDSPRVETQTFDSPLGLALTHDGFLYVSESGGRIIQIAPDGRAYLVAGAGGGGFADGVGRAARFNDPAGIAVDRHGALYVADGANYLVRKLTPADGNSSATPNEGDKKLSDGSGAENAPDVSGDVLPRIDAGTLGVAELPWPLDPQRNWHELVATMGEVRGSYDGESRHHLHAGLDIQGAHGATVRVVFEEKVMSPLPNWDFGGLNEGIGVGLLTYVHLRVGRTQTDEALDQTPFIVQRGADGKVSRVRVRRGTRLRVGDALGTVNRMYHVHLNYGPWGAEANPLQLPLIDFKDSTPPRIEPDGIHVLDQTGKRLTERRAGRLVVSGDVDVVVDAYDQVDKNLARRKLGLFRLGYQVLKEDGSPAPGFDAPRTNLVFDRLPPEREAVKLAYADASGITVYGSSATRFLYTVTNTVRHGRASDGVWRAGELPPGKYILRIIAHDFAGNEATAGRDLPVVIE